MNRDRHDCTRVSSHLMWVQLSSQESTIRVILPKRFSASSSPWRSQWLLPGWPWKAGIKSGRAANQPRGSDGEKSACIAGDWVQLLLPGLSLSFLVETTALNLCFSTLCLSSQRVSLEPYVVQLRELQCIYPSKSCVVMLFTLRVMSTHTRTCTHTQRERNIQFGSVAQSCPALWDPTDCSTPGLPVHHQLSESTQTHVHRVGDAIQPSHPLSSSSPPAFNLSQHQDLFQRVSSSHQAAKVL